MNTLTQAQKDNHASVNQRLGLAPDAHLTLSNQIKSIQQQKKNLVFSSDPLESDVPPIHVSVGSIAEFKKMVGVPDGNDDGHVTYPDPLADHHRQLMSAVGSKAELLSRMDDQLFDKMQKAAYAYVMGDSRKVQEYEPLINSLMFPGRIAVFTGEDLDIPSGETYTIKGEDPVVMNFEEITEGQNAEIMITTNCSLHTQYFTQK
ncbi:hypothetical protein CLV59_105461 [Chitinophaga dinghuensis]|uniref:Uncharacterized protein n=1 Tax=Chitinophaga dinghuensis TaxID=1539050 RepID=A0A327VXW2_9BACT|nr:hypothetical protein [Chitinophaga dinghuensis]RAJ80352.1 hypothetical protein CLV59_105461 [Chitinophaga dinghuensis]